MDRDCSGPAQVRKSKRDTKTVKGLVNARLLEFEFPDTFSTPSDSAIKKIKPGDFVKLARNAERFWLRVDGFVGRKWHGTISNKLISNKDIKLGDSIYFMRKNIYDIQKS